MSAALAPTRPGEPVATGTSAWSTPGKLRILIAISWVLAAMLFLTGEARLDSARHAVKTIGKDAAPSIIAAQEIGLALGELDANVANALLGTAAHRAAATAAVETQRLALTKSMVDAAENITFGEAEKVPIQALFSNFGRYLELATEARVLFERASRSGAPTEKDASGAVAAYWAATDFLHRKLLKSADELDAANRAYLNQAYKEERSASGGAIFIALVVGGALLATLLYAQLFMFRHMRRIINPGLLVASLITVAYTGYLMTRFDASNAHVKLAVEDAFDSVHAMVKARAIAYDANGDESRWLLEPADARGFEAAFRAKVALLTTSPEAAPPSGKAVAFTGLFADEFKNVTFEGEHEAAADMTRQFTKYYAIDREIRRLHRAGKRDAAIELCIGDRPDQSNAAFYRFDQAILKLIAINRTEFDRAIEAETSALKTAEIIAPFCTLAIALLAFLGIRARLREYRA